MANRDNLKTVRVSLPEDSPVWLDLLELGQEMGLQPSEAARVALTEWSRALRGRIAIGGGVPQIALQHAPVPAPVETSKANGSQADAERERTKARVTRLGGGLKLDDDDE